MVFNFNHQHSIVLVQCIIWILFTNLWVTMNGANLSATLLPITNQNGLHTNQTDNDNQNLFQSSISCGQSEFYVQITFTNPFKGLLYAYRTGIPDSIDPAMLYTVQVLDTCTLRGNGASVIYLELSFFSECVERLTMMSSSSTTTSTTTSSPTINLPSEIGNFSLENGANVEMNQKDSTESVHINRSNEKFNLDGFNFRRALNDDNGNVQSGSQMGTNVIESNQLYQLSLYIQNDPYIEQKTDSKVTIQCSSKMTKNIIFEQNLDYSRRLEPGNKERAIVPSATLTIGSNRMSVNSTNDGSISARIDILRGRVPFVKTIDKTVELGDDLTIIVRVNHIDGFETRVGRCVAYDGNNRTNHELTNKYGCPADGSSITMFKTIHPQPDEPNGGQTIHYTTFSAFKFIDNNHVRIECQLLICEQQCSKVTCERLNGRQFRTTANGMKIL